MPLRPGIAGTVAAVCAAKPIRTVDHLRRLTHRVIADLEATGMVLRRGTTARRNGTRGHRPLALSLGTQVVKISGQAAARTRLHHYEEAAGFHPVTVESAVYDHKAYDPSCHRTTMRVTGDRATGRLLGIQLLGQKRAEIAKPIDIPASDPDRSYIPPTDRPWAAVHTGRRAGPGHLTALTRSGY
jgi:hypothetical protein